MSTPSAAGPRLADRAVELARRWTEQAAAAEADSAAVRLAGVLRAPESARFVCDLVDEVLRPESLTAAASALHRLAPQTPDDLPRYLRSVVQIGGAAAPVLPAPIVPIVRRAVRDLLAPLFVDARPAKLREFLVASGPSTGSGTQEGSSAAQVGSSGTQVGSSGNREGSSGTREGSSAAQEGSSAAQERGSAAQVGSSGTQERGSAAQEGGSATHETHPGTEERLGTSRPGVDLRLLGGAVLGEAEAERRLDSIHDLVRRPDVDHVTLRVSDVVGPFSLWAFDEVVDDMVQRLLPLYVSAARSATFVTLDVSEYRSFDLTIAVFTRLLEDPRLALLPAGVTLPCALPDAREALRELTAWATHRVEHGGEPITVRLTTRLDATDERAEERVQGWTAATYDNERDSTANLLRCLDEALQPESASAVRLGVASDDLFTIAYAWLLAGERELQRGFEIVMTHGAAPGHAQAVSRDVGTVLLSVPVVPSDAVDLAAGALIRPLADGERATPEAFYDAVARSVDLTLPAGPRRTQNRLAPVHESVRQAPVVAPEATDLTQAVLGISRGSSADEAFVETAVYSRRELADAADAALAGDRSAPASAFKNTANSDPALAANREWARQVRARVSDSTLGEKALRAARIDDSAALQVAVAGVRAAAASWGALSAAHRAEVLVRAAGAIEARRGEFIEAAASEADTLFADADREVSDAVDFARHCATQARELDAIAGARFEPMSVTVVGTPAHGGLSAPAGRVLAVLAAGSGVVFRAGAGAGRSAALLAETLWQSGVPRDALGLIDIDDSLERELREHADVDRVLGADRVGNGATVVTPSADLDLVVADIVRSAFGRSGRAPGSASLVILVGAVGRSAYFARQLADAVRSLHVGWPDDLRADVGPLGEAPQGLPDWARSELGDGEQWLVRPEPVADDETGRLWRPGVRTVRAGSRWHRDALEGPVIGVIHVATLTQAIELQNGIGAPLAAGLHTRDPDELSVWLSGAEADTLFVNRDTVATRVRQQLRGCEPGSAGGPNDLIRLGSWRSQTAGAASSTLHLRGLDTRIASLIEAAQPTLDFEAFEWLRRSALSDAVVWDRQFGRVRDVAQLGVERNLLRYRPVSVMVRATGDAQWQELLRVVIAGIRTGSDFVLSTPVGLPAIVRRVLGDLDVLVYMESDAEWVARMTQIPTGVEGLDAAPRASRVRLVGSREAVSEVHRLLLSATGGTADLDVFRGEVTSAGRIELLTFLREQSLSITAHRRGKPDAWSAAVI